MKKILLQLSYLGGAYAGFQVQKNALALIPILVPLFVSSFRRADELAVAMECRCYHGGEGRTRLKTLRLTAKDWLLSAVCVAVLCCIACSGALWARFWG